MGPGLGLYHLSGFERVFLVVYVIYDIRRKCFLICYVVALASSCEFALVRNIMEFIVKIHMTA